MVADAYSHITGEDKRFNAQCFDEQFYQAKALADMEGKTAPMPKFEAATELLDQLAVTQDELEAVAQPDEEEKQSTDPEAELLAKLLANPETAALLQALAKSV